MPSWIMRARQALPSLVIKRLDDRYSRRSNRASDDVFGGDDPSTVFKGIYKNGIWGHAAGSKFYSGTGSNLPEYVEPYISAVAKFLSSMPAKPSVVDLGCGDFNIGRQVRPYCDKYVACDVVQELIDNNRTTFENLGVDFRCLDATEADLPDGDVIFIRQVLQHLNNEQIAKIVAKLSKYRFLILTETLPDKPHFPPNREKRSGPGVRLSTGSGVVLTAPPFSLHTLSHEEICSVTSGNMNTQTILYRLH